MKNLKKDLVNFKEVNLNEEVIDALRDQMEEAARNVVILRNKQKEETANFALKQKLEMNEMENKLKVAEDAFNKVFEDKDLIDRMLETLQ